MQNKRNRLFKTLTTVVIAAALALMGTVPSFAGETVYEGAEEPPDATATSICVMNADTGDVLYEKNGHKKRDPASVTKILNLLVCLDNLNFDETITVDKTTTGEGSTMQLANGETLKIGDIAYGMMLWSANDGAEYLGYLCARTGKGDGEMDTFCDMMNAKAKSIGAKDTKYNNPNGLNPKEVNNVTTAYDIALMVKEGMKDKRFRDIVSTRQYTIPKTNKHKKRIMTNSNRCLWDDQVVAVAKGDKKALDKYAQDYRNNPYNYIDESVDDEMARDIALNQAKAAAAYMYKPCCGVKTGYSSTAGDCFAGVARKGNTTIIAVFLNSAHTSTKFKEAKKFWKYGFNNFQNYTAQKASDFEYEMKVKRGTLREIELGIPENLCITALKKETPSETVTTEIELTEEKPTAPIDKGTVVGQLVAYKNGEKIGSQELIAMESVGKGGPLSYIGIADEDVPKFIIIVVLILLVLLLLWAYIRIQRRNRARRRRRAERRAAEAEAMQYGGPGMPSGVPGMPPGDETYGSAPHSSASHGSASHGGGSHGSKQRSSGKSSGKSSRSHSTSSHERPTQRVRYDSPPRETATYDREAYENAKTDMERVRARYNLDERAAHEPASGKTKKSKKSAKEKHAKTRKDS